MKYITHGKNITRKHAIHVSYDFVQVIQHPVCDAAV